MKLHQLTLSNFQGIKEFTFDFEGKNAIVHGDNATGKTTLFNALTWLLFGTSSTGAKGFTPKTIGKDGEMHGLDHTVEAMMEFDDGSKMPLKKVYKEIWKTKRGSTIEEFSGHTTDYYVNGVPVSEKEFNAKLPAQDKMKLITVPWFFAEGLAWQDRRKVLIEIGGDITDDTILALPNMKKLNEIIENYKQRYNLTTLSVNEFKAVAQSNRSLLNKSLEALPARIDEATKAMPEGALDTNDSAFDSILASELKNVESEIEKLMTHKVALLNPPTDEQNAKAEADIKLAMVQLETKLSEAYQEELREWRKVTQAHESKSNELKNAQIHVLRRVEAQTERIKRMESLRESLLEEFKAVSAVTWDKHKEICPTCNRPLDPQDVQKLMEAFNVERATKLEAIQKRGKEEASFQMIQDEQKKLDELNAELEKLNKEIRNHSAPLLPAMPTLKNMTVNPEWLKLNNKLNELSWSSVTKIDYEAVEAVEKQIRDLKANVERINQITADKAAIIRQKKRIEELEAERKSTAKTFEEVELGLRLCELFTKTKMDMLSEAVNKRFKNVSFRLFQEQINGGIKEDCEVLVPGPNGQMVPFTFANNGHRINAGLEIIGVLAEYYGFTMPVFVDNAEAVTKLNQTNYQVIQLVVSESDKKLNITKEVV